MILETWSCTTEELDVLWEPKLYCEGAFLFDEFTFDIALGMAFEHLGYH
jgi:hypothetical protein